MSENVFEVRDLVVEHRRIAADEDTSRQRSLDKISLDIRRGSRAAILGISGSGKSTLLSVLGSIRSSRSCTTSGHIWFQGAKSPRRDVLTLPPHAADIYRGKELGFVLPDSPLLGNLTCLHNLSLPLLQFGASQEEAEAQVIKYVRQIDRHTLESEVKRRGGESADLHTPLQDQSPDAMPQEEGLLPHINKYPWQLSSGQRQRFAVLRSIVHDPEVILADEPFSNLDPFNHSRMLKLLADWQQMRGDAGMHPTIILVSHHWDTALEWAQDAFVLHDGKLSGGRPLPSQQLLENWEQLSRLLFGSPPPTEA